MARLIVLPMLAIYAAIVDLDMGRIAMAGVPPLGETHRFAVGAIARRNPGGALLSRPRATGGCNSMCGAPSCG